MKKLMFSLGVVMMAVAANAGCWWSWWVGDEKSDKDLTGCQLGIASECKEMQGAQVSLLWNRMKELHNGAQVAWGYNNAEKIQNGAQVAAVNIADHAALQFGLVCINKGGFLPWFIFFNFDKSMFGGAKK